MFKKPSQKPCSTIKVVQIELGTYQEPKSRNSEVGVKAMKSLTEDRIA
jgi:hypothetical protein